MVEHPRSRILLKRLINTAQLLRQPHVVRVQQRDDFATRVFESKIKRGSLPAIRLLQITNGISEFSQARRRVVGRTVVHHQNLPLLRRKILRQDTRDRFLYVLPVVVAIDQDGEKGRFHPCFPRSGSVFLRNRRKFSARRPSLLRTGRVSSRTKNHTRSIPP